jgi:hypothetical protein
VQEVESTETELREYMLRELTVGSGEGGAGPRCGIIGEVVIGDGTGPTGSCAELDLDAADEKVLRAAAAAHAGTGAPVLVSVPRCGRSPALVPRLLQLLLGGGGVAPDRLLIAGLGFTCDEADVRAVLEAGCMLALALGSGASEVQTRPAPAAQGGQADGATFSPPPPPPLCVAAGDAAVAALVTRVCEAGHSSQVALCHSYLFKTQLAAYGGEGLGLGPFLARLPARLDPASRRAMAGGNVARALAWWVRPRPPPPAPRASCAAATAGPRVKRETTPSAGWTFATARLGASTPIVPWQTRRRRTRVGTAAGEGIAAAGVAEEPTQRARCGRSSKYNSNCCLFGPCTRDGTNEGAAVAAHARSVTL